MYWESAYVQDIKKSIEKGTKSAPTKYTMTNKNYQEISQNETINDEIETVTGDPRRQTTQDSSAIDFDRQWFHDKQHCKNVKDNRKEKCKQKKHRINKLCKSSGCMSF